MKRIGLIGQSHMGIITGLGWASLGYEVMNVDTDPNLAAALSRGQFPIREPRLEELFDKHRHLIQYSSDFSLLSSCPLIILTKDTPTDENNGVKPEVLLELIRRAAPYFRNDVVFVSMSQVPVGFSRTLVSLIREERPGLPFEFYFWVETLILGEAVQRFLEPERIIIGLENPQNDIALKLKEFLAEFHCPVFKMKLESAELTKAAINLYLANSVTFANTLADLCEASGADIDEIIPALRLDRRIGKYAYLRPGLGIGGGNIERDLAMLHNLSPSRPLLLSALLAYNEKRFSWLLKKLDDLVFRGRAAPHLCLWGLAYKKNTASLKNSPALRAVNALSSRATLVVYDPLVNNATALRDRAAVGKDRYEVLKGSDALLIMTDWDEFASIDVLRVKQLMRTPLIIDTVKALASTKEALRDAEIKYCSMGEK